MNSAVADQQIQVPLPLELYQKLQAEAERTQQPTAALVQLAVEFWLNQHIRQAMISAEIAAFAAEYGGTEFDLNPELEAAGVEFLRAQPE